MPVPTLEQLAKKQESLSKSLADAGESMEAAKRRKLHKSIKRTQRKGLRLRASAEKATKKDDAAPAES